MQDDKTGNGPKFADRRSVLKLIGGTTAAGLAVPGIGSAESRSQVSATSGGFSDSEPDNYSGSDPHGTFWYQEYRGFMNSACDPTIGSKSSQNGGAMDEIVDLAQVCFMNTKCALAGERWLPHAIKVSDQSSLF